MPRGGGWNKGQSRFKDFIEAMAAMEKHDLLVWTGETPAHNMIQWTESMTGKYRRFKYKGTTFVVRVE